MPKTYLTELEKRDETLRRNIRVGMARKGINTVAQLAQRIGMSRGTLADKMESPGTFKVSDLRRIYKALGMEFPIDKEAEIWL